MAALLLRHEGGLTQCSSQSGQLCDVPELRSQRSSSCTQSPRMERSGISYPGSPTSPGSGFDGPTDHTLRDLLQAAHDRFQLHAAIPGDGSGTEGRQLPLPEMESQAQEDRDLERAQHSSSGHEGTTPEDPTSILGVPNLIRFHSLKSTKVDENCTQHGDSMETATLGSQRRPHDRSTQLGEQLHMAAGGREIDGSTASNVPVSHRICRDRPSTRLPQTLRDQYLEKLIQMTFHNDHHYCWLNAGLRSALWCLISTASILLGGLWSGASSIVHVFDRIHS